jgi:hypothetical protein
MSPWVLGIQFVFIAGNGLFFNRRVIENQAYTSAKLADPKDQPPKWASHVGNTLVALWLLFALLVPLGGKYAGSFGMK